jgi:hypothetical protein
MVPPEMELMKESELFFVDGFAERREGVPV